MAQQYNNCKELIEDSVLPLMKKYPNWIRLDGQMSGGNRNHFALFRYNGNTWQIHSDTHISELIKAHEQIQTGNDPFITTKTTKSCNICLELKPELANKPKHIYIYMVK